MKITNFKIVLRRMFKDKVITLINLSGLSLGIACVIILTSWVLYETSYDKHIPDGDMIYRITLEGEINGEFIKSTQTLAGIPPEVKKDFPELDSYVRLVNQFSDCVIQREGQECFRESGYAADSTFFDVFPYKAVYGNLKTALAQLDQIVIDQYLSEICFGDEDPIGQILSVDDHKFTVAAVMENIPAQSHLKFHFLIPFINAGWMVKNQWGGDNVNTFLKFKHIDNVEFIESKITELVYSHESQWKDLGIVFRLQPLYDIYLSDYKYDYAAEKGSKKNILIFSITAFLVLLIACINFTNLFIASSLKRKRAMGIMLVNGAQRTHLLRESFLEVFLFLLLSFFVAIALVKTIEPFFMALAGKEIVIHVFSFQFLALSVPIILVSLVLTSLFPWIYFRGLSLVRILKEGRSGGHGKFNIQKILVTTQFVIAIILIFNVLIVSKQLAFLQDKQLGFEKENVVYVYTTGKLQKKYIQKRMKNELLQNPSILGVAVRSSLPTIWNNGNPLSNKAEYKEVMPTEEILVDEDYFDLMHINFIEGENIFKQKNGGKDFCIINQMAAEKLGLEAPFIDKVIYQGPNKQLIVKGVTENVNTKPLMQMVDPCVYRVFQNKGKNGIILIKITDNYEEAIKAIKRFCTATNPNSPFEYHFLDEVYDELYASETTSRSIMLVFALLAIIIISLGLLAMVLFITESRIKEIGIRKVNGATISEILLMLNKDFIKWVAIAFVIAVPIAYYAMSRWLENFAYKTELSWWIFALAGVLALGIALLTVSFQSWRAATRNPIESLRYE